MHMKRTHITATLFIALAAASATAHAAPPTYVHIPGGSIYSGDRVWMGANVQPGQPPVTCTVRGAGVNRSLPTPSGQQSMLQMWINMRLRKKSSVYVFRCTTGASSRLTVRAGTIKTSRRAPLSPFTFGEPHWSDADPNADQNPAWNPGAEPGPGV